MIEVKDEILESEARYRIRDNQGNILFDNLIIEQITPVIQEATPQNKDLFYSIKSGNDLVQMYNTPQIDKLWDDYNYLSLDNKIIEYEVGMRVLVKVEQQFTDFNSSIIPKLTAINEPVKGFYTPNTIESCINALDKDDTTYVDSPYYLWLSCPVPIRVTKAIVIGRLFNGKSFKLYGDNGVNASTTSGTVLGSLDEIPLVTPSTPYTYTITVTDSNYYDNFGFHTNTPSDNYVYDVDIVEGSVGMFNKALDSYININNLGYKLVASKMEAGKTYELVYDGTVFNAREVV